MSTQTKDVFPRSSITNKLPTYRAPSGVPISEEEQQAYRKLIFAVAAEAKRKVDRPIDLNEIYYGVYEWKNGLKQKEIVEGVQNRVRALINDDLWAFEKFVRSKRTVDRRVNDCAAPDFCPNNVSWLVCVSPGIYQVNPALFEKKPLEA